MEYQVKVENPSNIQRKLIISVSKDIVAKRLATGYSDVQRKAKIKGFRPGMVPMNLVKQYYGADVRHQVFHNIIDEFYPKALREQKIRAVNSPQISTPDHQHGQGEHDHEIKDGQDLTFTATVEIIPEIEVKGYTGLSLTKGKTEVTEIDVDKVIESIQDNRAELIAIESESHRAKKGEFVDMKFDGGVVTDAGLDKRPGMEGSRVLEIGSDSLIPGFEENLVGMKRGETKTFRIPFPADYFEKDLAGKDAEFTVTVSEIKEKKRPPVTEELAKDMGYESIADMRVKAKEHLVKQKATDSDRKLRSDLLGQLIEKNSFECPQSLVQAQARVLAQDVAKNLKNQGFTDQMVQEALTHELENISKRAESQVRASLVLEAIAKKENLDVTDADIDAEIKSMAENMKAGLEEVKEFYAKNPSRRDDLEFRMREDKAVEFLFSKSKIKEEK